MLLRDIGRARIRLRTLEAEIERQGDVIWDLRESEERSRSLLDGQGDLIVRRDAKRSITYANDAFCTLAGRGRLSIVDTPFMFPVAETGFREVRDGGVVRRDEAIETVQGVRWIEWQDVPVRGPGGRPETQSVGRDVTARHEAELAAGRARAAAEAASQAKSRFLATVTHEIRTPLGGILGMADLLLDTGLAPDQTAYARAVKTSGATLLSLIDEILDFSKIEAGRLDLDERPFGLAALVEDVVELLAPRAHEKGLEIASRVAADLPASVIGDAARLRQVLLNLAGNAVKFTSRGGVTVDVKAENGRTVVCVEDSGIGIAPEHLPAIFREFEQADSTPARAFGGTGLGLAISQRIVERMGGSIEVSSTLAEGSMFRVVLDLPSASREAAPHRPVATGRRVLLASPSPIAARMLTAMLADIGTTTQVAADADAAQAAIGQRGFDAVLVDRAFGPDGTAALAKAVLTAGCRAIVLVTPGERHELGRLTAGGAAGYLIKPVRAASLREQVRGRRRLQPANDDLQPNDERPLADKRILLAEDNEINALVARTVLGKLGATVTWARDGSEAVAAHRAGRFDAVLMDMNMPGLDGPSATRAIRVLERDSGANRTPVYALTANIQAEDRDVCLLAGMDDFLTKPLDREGLVALLAPMEPPAKSA